MPWKLFRRQFIYYLKHCLWDLERGDWLPSPPFSPPLPPPQHRGHGGGRWASLTFLQRRRGGVSNASLPKHFPSPMNGYEMTPSLASCTQPEKETSLREIAEKRKQRPIYFTLFPLANNGAADLSAFLSGLNVVSKKKIH